MDMATLNWYLISLNWLKLSDRQIEIVKDVQEQIGEVTTENIFGALYWRNVAGNKVTLSSFTMEDYDKIPEKIITELRFNFAVNIFKELFKTNPDSKQRKTYYDLMSGWCENMSFSEKGHFVDTCLSSSSHHFEARSYLLGL